MKSSTHTFAFALSLLGALVFGPTMSLAAGTDNTQTEHSAVPISASVKKGSKQGKPPPRKVSEAQFDFVRSNLVATLYHEFGHALIDELDLPVLGQEEDAADVLSAVMLERFFIGPALDRIALNTALGFEADARDQELEGDDWAWSDVHGPDWQRYYNFVCLYYGADPENREDFANDMGLPRDRMESCVDEQDLASRSWGLALDRITANAPGSSIGFSSRTRTERQKKAARIVAEEVARLNKSYVLPKKLRVVVKHCGEDSSLSAFYTSGRVKITVCTEYIDQLYHQAPK